MCGRQQHLLMLAVREAGGIVMNESYREMLNCCWPDYKHKAGSVSRIWPVWLDDSDISSWLYRKIKSDIIIVFSTNMAEIRLSTKTLQKPLAIIRVRLSQSFTRTYLQHSGRNRSLPSAITDLQPVRHKKMSDIPSMYNHFLMVEMGLNLMLIYDLKSAAKADPVWMSRKPQKMLFTLFLYSINDQLNKYCLPINTIWCYVK